MYILSLIFSLLLFLAPGGSALQAGEKPYVILISMDGFRYDYVQRVETPNFDDIIDRGVSALSLQPAFPSKTFPNHLSIITGMYPEHHGIIRNTFTDPFTGEKYRIGDPAQVTNPRWYLGEAFWETAERQGITTASYFWPGSEMTPDYRHPTYFEAYEHKRPYLQRIEGVLQWLQLPEPERPHFITLYFDLVDSKGHQFGPNSPQVDAAVARMDSLLGVLRNGLEKIGMGEKVNLIIVSDHGMTELSPERVVNVRELAGDIESRFQGIGPVVTVEPKQPDLREALYQRLRTAQQHFRVYKREEMPGYFHFSKHPFIPSLILVADMGWTLITDRNFRGKGNHGYDNYQLDMHGIFYAVGPKFRAGYRTGTVRNIDIYPLLCELFGIMPRANIDGELNRIGFLLNESK